MNEAIARRLADGWLDAWNRHDLEAVLSHYAEDVELTSPFVSKLAGATDCTLRGKERLREYFARSLAAFPHLKFELLQVLPGVSSVTLLYRGANDLLAAEVMTLDAQGRAVRVQVHCTSAPAPFDTGESNRNEWRNARYLLTDDPRRLDLDAVCALLHATYWADDRPREIIEKSLRHSVCLSLIHEDKMVGLIRGVTDHATFTWVCDVVVHPDHRGRGLGKWMTKCFLEHPALQTISHHLCTKDAHGLYEQFGFKRIEAMRRSTKPLSFLLV